MVNAQFSMEQFKRLGPATAAPEQPATESPAQQMEPNSHPQEQPKYHSMSQFLPLTANSKQQSPEEEESTIQWLTRNVVSNLVRVGEEVAGAPGNIYRAAQDAIYNAPSVLGVFGKYVHDWVGDDTWKKMIYGSGLEGAAGIKPPTSEQIKKGITEPIAGEFTEPRTPGEKQVQALTSDIGSTLLTRRPASLKNIAMNNFGIPALSNLVKETVEYFGFGEDKATVAKLGTWMALSLSGNVNGQKEAARLVREGREALPEFLRGDVSTYQKKLNELEKQFLHGDPRSELARSQISSIRQDIQNGQLSIQELMNRYDSINAVKESRGLFELSPKVRRVAIRNVNEVLGAVREQIMEAGKSHPEALKSWRDGLQAYSVIHRSKRMTQWADRLVRSPQFKFIGPMAGTLFGLSFHNFPAVPGQALGIPLAAPLLYKSGQVAHRIWNDPSLSKYYWGAMSAAAAENTDAFVQNMNKLQKSYEAKAKKKGWDSVSLRTNVNTQKKDNSPS